MKRIAVPLTKKAGREAVSGNSDKSVFTGLHDLHNYVLAAVFLTVFALYCSGRVGWYLLLVLLAAPLLSMAAALLSVRHLRAEVAAGHLTMDKGNRCVIRITLRNTSFLPIPFAELYLRDNPHVRAEGRRTAAEEKDAVALPAIACSMISRSTETFEFGFRAELAGGSEIGIDRLIITDFFGLLRLRVRDAQITNKTVVAGVIPTLLQSTTGDHELLAQIKSSMIDYESDETSDEVSLNFGGFPGYDYRPYVPGDPLKRLNSKISLKRDELFVRLDEKQVNGTVAVILDPALQTDDTPDMTAERTATLEQDTLEQALRIAGALLRAEYSVVFYRYDRERNAARWQSEPVADEGALMALAQSLAYIRFAKNNDEKKPGRLPAENTIPAEAPLLYCTPYLDQALHAALAQRNASAPGMISVFHTLTGEWRRV